MLCWVLVANVWKCPRNQAEAPRVEHQPGVSHISNTVLTSSRLSTSGVQLDMFIYYFYYYYFFFPIGGFRCIMGTFRPPENDSHNYPINAFGHICFSQPEGRTKREKTNEERSDLPAALVQFDILSISSLQLLDHPQRLART